jgi:hypothetical protein
MSVVIKTEYKNGAKNIKESRSETNQSNYIEDRLVWEYIAANPCSSIFPKFKKTKTGRNSKDTDYNEIGDKISNYIVRDLSHIYNVDDITNVSKEMISEIAQLLLISDPRITIPFSRNACRQTVDELTQFATLQKYVNNTFTWNKPVNGLYTLCNGDIIIANTIKKKKDVKEANARSIDFICNGGDITIHVFAKYTEAAGSSQSHQVKESKNFINEAIAYVNKHNTDNMHFYVLIDGKWGESHIPELNTLCQQYVNINCGNCESLIDFVNSL